jgi:hypothetical protein
MAIDDQKNRGNITFAQDQLGHVACKAFWLFCIINHWGF